MICEPCRRGAQAAVLSAEESRDDIKTRLAQSAVTHHARCAAVQKGHKTWCDCQHETTTSLAQASDRA